MCAIFDRFLVCCCPNLPQVGGLNINISEDHWTFYFLLFTNITDYLSFFKKKRVSWFNKILLTFSLEITFNHHKSLTIWVRRGIYVFDMRHLCLISWYCYPLIWVTWCYHFFHTLLRSLSVMVGIFIWKIIFLFFNSNVFKNVIIYFAVMIGLELHKWDNDCTFSTILVVPFQENGRTTYSDSGKGNTWRISNTSNFKTISDFFLFGWKLNLIVPSTWHRATDHTKAKWIYLYADMMEKVRTSCYIFYSCFGPAYWLELVHFANIE